MTAATLANLVLTFSLATSGPVAEAPAAQPEQPGQPVVMEPGEASGNGAVGHQGGHEAATLPEVMMHHVANGEVMELPGFCPSFQWNCEVNFRKLTGGWVLHLDGVTLDMTPSKHLVMMWLASLLLTVLMLAAARRRSLVPRGLYNFFELLVQFVRGIAVANIGKRHADRFVPYLAAAFFFILFMNLLGLVPFMATATANVSVTVALALFTFVITQYTAIRSMGLGGFLKHLTGGVPVSMCWLWPIMVPVEIMGLFTKPFALTVRLFANMVAGHFVILALLGLIFSISILVAPASVAIAVAMCLLELFVAFVQAYIFTMLSALFIGSGLVHHGDHEQEHAHPGAVEHGSHVAGKVPGHG